MAEGTTSEGDQQEQQTVRPLAELTHTAMVSQLQSHEAREIARRLGQTPTDFVEVAAEIANAERRHLHARGRICAATYNRGGQQLLQYNSFGMIDGARFDNYDEEQGILRIRIDHSEIPEFWLTVDVPLKQLRAWMREQTTNPIARSHKKRAASRLRRVHKKKHIATVSTT